MNKVLQNYECDGQINLFDYLQAVPKECTFSGHTCNKLELWKVAEALDDIKCPRTCCRSCDVRMCGARCNGSEEPEPFMNPPEEPEPETTDDYIKEHPTCFYVFGYYLDKEDGWHKVPDCLPTFTKWKKIDVVVFGEKTGTPWMEHEKWEAKDWTFRSIDERRDAESIKILAWKLSEEATE